MSGQSAQTSYSRAWSTGRGAGLRDGVGGHGGSESDDGGDGVEKHVGQWNTNGL